MPANVGIRENLYEVQHRSYLTPHLISKMFAELNPAFCRCGQSAYLVDVFKTTEFFGKGEVR